MSTSTATPSFCSSVASPCPTSRNETTSSPRAGAATEPASSAAANARVTTGAATRAASARRPRGTGSRHETRRQAARTPRIAAASSAYAPASAAGEPSRSGTTAAGAAANVWATHSTNASSGALTALKGSASAGATCAAAAPSIPSHITGAIAAAASRLAGRAASDTCSKCSAISGAVPTVAAIVIAATSATGSGIRRASTPRSRGASASSATTAANESCQPGLADRARVQRERHRCGEPERVPAVRRPPRERGDEAGRAHHARALDRRAGARERHVERHEREGDQQPRAQRQSEDGAGREHERGQQHHVLAADREHVGEARALELVAHVVGQPLVLAEHHPAQQRRLRLGQPARQPGLGAAASGVDEPGGAAAARAGPRHGRHLDGRARAAPALVRVEPPERRHRAAHRDDLADARPAASAARAHAQHGHLAVDAAAQQPRPRHGRADRPLADRLEQHRAGVDRSPVHVRQRPAFERAEPHVCDRRARQHGGRGEQRQRRGGGGQDRRDGSRVAGERCRGRRAEGERRRRRRGNARGGDEDRRRRGRRHHRRRRERAGQEAGGDREEEDVARVAVDRREDGPHLTPAPARAARRAGRRRSRAPGRAPRPTRSRRWPRGSRGCSGPWRGRCRRARRAARAWPC